MWDNPRLLNAAAGFLVGLALFGFALAGAQLALRSPAFPVRSVEVLTPLKHASREAIERAVRARTGGNFWSARIDELRRALEQVPWVRRVEVRRVWPDRLEVTLEEHVALARWGAGDEMSALVNTHGERFTGKTQDPLPLFIGPAGTQAEVARRYASFSAIVAPLGTKVERVVLSARHAWQLRLANGLHLALGRDPEAAELRLKSFVAAYPATLSAGGRRYEYVDLRYPNGFAVRVPDLKS